MKNEIVSTRQATLEDLPELRKFEQGVVHAERPFAKNLQDGDITYYNLEQLISSDDAELLVAECGSNLVGSGYAKLMTSKPYLKHPIHSYLGFMYVDPAYRGRGINKLIIEALIQWSKRKGVLELTLDVYDENHASIRAYEKIGFGKNLVQMRMELTP